MRNNLATIEDFDRGISTEGLSAENWQVPATSMPYEEYDQSNLPWRSQHVVGSARPVEIRVRVRGVVPRWFIPATERLTNLSKLQENWDSYGASAINAQAITQAIQVMTEVMTNDTPMPAIVPTTRGGIQLEWHLGGIDMEVEVTGGRTLSVLYEDATQQEPWEDELVFIPGLVPRRLTECVQAISERAA